MRFARFVLIIQAVIMAGLSLAYWLRPYEMANLNGMLLMESASVSHMRVYYGGLQLGLALFLLWAAREPERARPALVMLMITLLALVASLAVAVMQGIGLGTISSSVAQAGSLVPDYGELMVWRAGLLLVALGIWVLPQRRNSLPGLPVLSLAFVLLLAGELIGRGVFYGLHMTVGVAVAG